MRVQFCKYGVIFLSTAYLILAFTVITLTAEDGLTFPIASLQEVHVILWWLWVTLQVQLRY